jgi:lysophospholipase L1-like esterase
MRLGKDFLLVNSSVNGNTTRLALERMPYDLQSHSPNVVIVQFGMNDCNYWVSDKGVPRVSPKSFEANIHEIIDRCYVFGASQVFLNSNHPTTRDFEKMPHTNVSYEESNKQYNGILRKVAKDRSDIIFNDLEQVFTECLEKEKVKLEDCLLPDKLHLSVKGHDLYYDYICPRVEGYLVGKFSNASP